MVLMDTHILLWAFSDSDRLTESVRNAIDENDVCISIASLWEIAIKASFTFPHPSRVGIFQSLWAAVTF